MIDTLTIFEKAVSAGLPAEIEDFQNSAILDAGTLSFEAAGLLRKFRPFIEAVDWNSRMPGSKPIRKRFEATYKLGMAMMLRNLGVTLPSVLHKEATLAGTDIPNFTRQLLRVITRAYPDLITPQLFPVIPMTGPTARVFFENVLYDNAFASSSPNILTGDNTADLTKFNAAFFKQANQLDNLGLLKMSMDSIDISADTYGVSAISALQTEEDYASQYGRDYNAVMSERMAYHVKLAVDSVMIAAMVAAVPAANKVTWKRTPTINSVAWAGLAPSEQSAWREQIWANAFLPAMQKIYDKRYVRPNFAVCGSNAATDISSVKTFDPIRVDDSNIDQRTGAIRDLGLMDNGGLRILIAPMINTNKIYLGYRPQMEMEPSIFWNPYRMWGMADDFVDPRTLKRTKGGYTRFGITKPDGVNTDANILGEVYAEITISDAV